MENRQQKLKKQCSILAAVLLCAVVFLYSSSWGSVPKEETQGGSLGASRKEEAAEQKKCVIGLILGSMDAPENESLIESFQRLAEELDAELLMELPEVTEAEAKEARELTGEFIVCEVDPVEYQMLSVNRMVEKDASVIAIHANHAQALEPVLTAARSVGISVCAIEEEAGENSADVRADIEGAAEAVRKLIDEMGLG